MNNITERESEKRSIEREDRIDKLLQTMNNKGKERTPEIIDLDLNLDNLLQPIQCMPLGLLDFEHMQCWHAASEKVDSFKQFNCYLSQKCPGQGVKRKVASGSQVHTLTTEGNSHM